MWEERAGFIDVSIWPFELVRVQSPGLLYSACMLMTCAALPQPLYYYGRLADIVIGLSLVLFVAFCMPWYAALPATCNACSKRAAALAMRRQQDESLMVRTCRR